VDTALACTCRRTAPTGLEAALARRSTAMTRQLERLERHVTIANEATALSCGSG